MSYIVRNQFGAFCAACQNGPLSLEEDDWDCCDACGGHGLGDDADDHDFSSPSPAGGEHG